MDASESESIDMQMKFDRKCDEKPSRELAVIIICFVPGVSGSSTLGSAFECVKNVKPADITLRASVIVEDGIKSSITSIPPLGKGFCIRGAKSDIVENPEREFAKIGENFSSPVNKSDKNDVLPDDNWPCNKMFFPCNKSARVRKSGKRVWAWKMDISSISGGG